MTVRNMRGRVADLENVNLPNFRPCVWLIRDPAESMDEARARYEREHGPIGDRPALVWVCTGVPRGAGSIACA
jgi:hypothetical protein